MFGKAKFMTKRSINNVTEIQPSEIDVKFQLKMNEQNRLAMDVPRGVR